jgi:exodeoxyribonuclease-1
MANSFYWYDLETSGTEPKWDRIVQFAGVRTDADLNPIGDEHCTYVRLPDDVLPNPSASLVTGITPQMTALEGIREIDALEKINALFAVPGTCVAGYNSLRFDDEFVRYGLYRNLYDPYAREWQHGNSRWDLIDLVRATGGLRRDGIEWPRDDDDLPVYKLEELTKANGIDHGNAHDALSDVHATVAFARLIKTHQPRLFAYYFGLRHKKEVKRLLEPYGARLCVHVSGMYPRARYGVAPIMSLTRHPTNSNSIVVVDLMEDVESLVSSSAEELRARLFTAGAEDRPPLKEIRINRCPFVAPVDVLNEENIDRLAIDMKLVKERARRLGQPGIAQKIAQVYQQDRPPPNADVDAALYDGFLQDEDRSRCHFFHQERKADRWLTIDFKDRRLAALCERLKARGYPDEMTADEHAGWREFVATKLSGGVEDEGGWLNLARFERELGRLEHGEPLTTDQQSVLRDLAQHAADLREKYAL